eukprot:TRINITY_DN1890_c0_g2_i6.p1 TRINITY_DN1890_c0_g2~~TRINITY_DN1890_c0_g2_i6.p1  ORF type:complete len:1165 (+),score=327.42 TRINITY_DN1890_c0_g2_i6:108-3602(+)
MVNVRYCECVESAQIASIQPNATVEWISADFEDAKATYSFIRDYFDGFYGKKSVRYFLYKMNASKSSYEWIEQTEDGQTVEILTVDPPLESIYILVQKRDQAMKELEERIAKQRTLLEKANKIISSNKVQMQEKDATIAKLQAQSKESELIQVSQSQVSELQSEIEQLKAESLDWKQKFTHAQQQFDQQVLQIKSLQDDCSSLSQQLTEATQQLNSLKDIHAQEKQSWTATQEEKEITFSKLLQDKEQALVAQHLIDSNRLQQLLDHSQAQVADLQSKIEETKASNERMSDEIIQCNQKYQTELKSLQDQIAEARKLSSSYSREVPEQSTPIEVAATIDQSELQSQLDDLTQKLTQAAETEQELQARIVTLESSLSQKSDEIQSLSQKMSQENVRSSLPEDLEKIQSLENAQKDLIAGHDEMISKVKAAAVKKLESMKAQVVDLEAKCARLQSECEDKDATIKQLKESLKAQEEAVASLGSAKLGAVQENESHANQLIGLNSELQLKTTQLAESSVEIDNLKQKVESLSNELEQLRVETDRLRSTSLALENESKSGNDAMIQTQQSLKEKEERIGGLENELAALKAKHTQEISELTAAQEASSKKAKEDHTHQIEKMKTLIKDRVAKYEQRIGEMEKKHAESTKAMTSKISEALEEANKSMKSKDQKIRDLTSELDLVKKEQVEKEESKRFDFVTIARVSKTREEDSTDALKDRWCYILFRNSSGDVIRQGWEQASVVVSWLKQGKNWSKTDEFDFAGPAHKLLPPSIEESYEKQISDLEGKLRKIAQQSESQITTLKKENETLQKSLSDLEEEFQRYKTKAASAMKHHSGQQDTLKHELTKANEDLKSRLTELNEKLMELQSEHMEAVQQMSDEIHAAEKRAEQATDAATKEQILLKQKIKQLETERDSLKSESDKVLVHHESQMQQMRVKLLDANSTIDGLSATIDTLKTELKMAVAQKEAVFGKQADVGVQTAALAPVSIPRSGSAHHVPEPADSVTDTASEDAVSIVSSYSEVVQITPNYSFVHDYEQGQREAELKRLRHQVRELTANLEESHSTERLLVEQKKFLEHEIRELERARKRDEVKDGAVNMQYLKNVVVKYLQTDEESLFPVLATLLQFSPEEIKHIHEEREKRNGIAAVSSSATTAASGLWSLMDSYLRPM